MSTYVKTALWAGLIANTAIADSLYTFQTIMPCAGCGTLVSGINNSGQIAGSVYPSGAAPLAFTGAGGVFSIFGQPGAFFTEAIGISNTGRVTVNYFAPNGTGRAYILEPDGSKTFLPVVAGANYVL